MKIWRLGLAICALAAMTMEPLHADLKVTRKTSFEGRESYETEYFRRKLYREDRIEDNALMSETIIDRDKSLSYIVDPRSRQYSIYKHGYEGFSGTFIVSGGMCSAMMHAIW